MESEDHIVLKQATHSTPLWDENSRVFGNREGSEECLSRLQRVIAELLEKNERLRSIIAANPNPLSPDHSTYDHERLQNMKYHSLL
jgi:hypothetical protein